METFSINGVTIAFVQLSASSSAASTSAQNSTFFSTAREEKMSDYLFSLKEKVHLLLVERFFISQLTETVKLKKSFELRTVLQKQGFEFLYDGSSYSIVTPFNNDNIPLPLIGTVCQIERCINQINTFEIHHHEEIFQRLVQKVDSILKQTPSDKVIIEQYLQRLRYAQLRYEFQHSWNAIRPKLKEIESLTQSDMTATPYLQKIVTAWKTKREHQQRLNEEIRSKEKLDDQLMQQYSTTDYEIQNQFSDAAIAIIESYISNLPTLTKQYNQSFCELREAEFKEKKSRSITKLCSKDEIALPELFYLHPNEFNKNISFPQCSTYADSTLHNSKNVKKHTKQVRKKTPSSKNHTSKQSKATSIPKRPEESVFSCAERPIFEPEKTAPMSNSESVFSDSNLGHSASENSRFFKSFGYTTQSPPNNTEITPSTEKEQATHKTIKEECIQISSLLEKIELHDQENGQTPSPKEEETSSPLQPMKEVCKHSPVLKKEGKTVSKNRKPASTPHSNNMTATTQPQSHKQKNKLAIQKKITPFSRIQKGSGPNPSLMYTWHVQRWENPNPRLSPIVNDPEYASKQFSEREATIIRIRHSFGRALDQVLISTAKPFITQNQYITRKNYCLPGDLTLPWNQTLRGIFRVTIGTDGKIMHKFFTRQTSQELIDRYAQEGTFLSVFNDSEMENPSPSTISNYLLPDDGSRVTHACDYCITVSCVDGTTLTVVPFPEEI